MGRMSERCQNICGDSDGQCFIGNREQILCIADMVINKVSGVKAFIEMIGEGGGGEDATVFDRALRNLNELIDWVKFLQIAHDLREVGRLSEEEVAGEHREEMRYPFPEKYRNYVGMRIGEAGSSLPVVLLNFSRRGIQFRSSQRLSVDSSREGLLFTERHPVRKSVSFTVRIKHCTKRGDAFIVGGRIENISDDVTLDFFKNVHEFVVESLLKKRGP